MAGQALNGKLNGKLKLALRRADSARAEGSIQDSIQGSVDVRPLGVVFLSGINLFLIQWVLVRELTALLLGTELVVLLVTVSYFAGLSLGYAISGRVSRCWLSPIAVVMLFLHLTLPVWFRLVVAALSAAQAYGLTFLLLPLITPFVISTFYSLFLPLFADTIPNSLPVLYGVEVAGSALGVVLLTFIGSFGLQALYAVYTVVLLVVLLLLNVRALLVGVVAVLAVGWLFVLPAASDWSNARWYQALHNLPEGTRTLFSTYTPYQKIDVMENPAGARYLYLDGLEHFGDPDGERLNVVMGYIPGLLVQPDNALVVGAGSMQMARMIAQNAGQVTTVELDPRVVEASLRYFTEANWMDRLTNRRIIIDDAKHFIANTTERYQLVATDVPAAYSVQTATLYSAPFYAEIKRHLDPGGVLVVGLTSDFKPSNLVTRRVAASLLVTFNEVMVITPESVGWSFAYAGDDLPFTPQQVEQALRDTGETQYVIFDTSAVRAMTGDVPPITLDTMDIVLQVSADWVSDRLSP